MIPFTLSPDFVDWLRWMGVDWISLSYREAQEWADLYEDEWPS